MSLGHEIDYGALIDRSIKDFRPARRLWSTGARLVCWILFEAAILTLALCIRGYADLGTLFLNPGQLIAAGLFIAASIAAAFLALKSAIPGREVSWLQGAIAIAMLAAAFGFEPAGKASEILETAPILMLQLFGLAALPWLTLFWAVRRGVPLRPEVTGAAVGLAAFCLAAALRPIVSEPARVSNSEMILVLCCAAVIGFSALAGRLWLNRIAHWQHEGVAEEISARDWSAFSARAVFPLALSVATAVLIFVLKGAGPHFARVPEFDLAIEHYERAVAGFHPNVPSTSMETMLTAYVEHGMPAYMWDFGPEGFKLVGGRWDPLPDGTPVTYTWFRGPKGGVMCIFKQIEAFNPPLISHDEHHHLLFYRYRDFSFCLINVGGYGNFISVIAAPMPLQRFEHLVLAATL
jgi:negative regulator of sigma F NrsF-like protein